MASKKELIYEGKGKKNVVSGGGRKFAHQRI